jgi:adenylosuccinate synthase
VYKKFGEVAATTGRIRRVGWLDLEIVRSSSQLSGVTKLCLTKLDVLSGLDEIKVCVGYKMNGKAVRYADVDAYGLSKVELKYKAMKGWKEDISNVRKFADLPVRAQSYVKLIEDVAGVPVKLIGVGPERDAIIKR